MRTDSQRYRTLVTTLAGRPEIRPLTAKEIEDAMSAAVERDVNDTVQKELTSTRVGLSAIRVATLPISSIETVPIEDVDPAGRLVLKPAVVVENPTVLQYVQYAEKDSVKDQELASTTSAEFEGQYYRNAFDGTYVRREILDVLQERPVFTRMGGSTTPLLFARDRSGIYVPLPEEFAETVFATSQRMRVAEDDYGSKVLFQVISGKSSQTEALRTVQKAMDAILKIPPGGDKDTKSIETINKIIRRASKSAGSLESVQAVKNLLTSFATDIQRREPHIQHLPSVYKTTLRRAEHMAETTVCKGVLVTYGDGSQACVASSRDLNLTTFDNDLYVQVNGTEYFVSVYSDEYSELLARTVEGETIDTRVTAFEIGAYGGLKVYNRYKIIQIRPKPIEFIPRHKDGSVFRGFKG